jgi:hypothetical protein
MQHGPYVNKYSPRRREKAAGLGQGFLIRCIMLAALRNIVTS